MKRYAVGCVEKCHGLDGQLRIRSFSGEYGHLAGLKKITAMKGGVEKILHIEEMRVCAGFALVHFSGLQTREQAEVLCGFELWVDQSEACPLADDEYHVADLCRCRVLVGDAEAGSVVGIMETPASLLLEVRRSDGVIRLVPFVAAHIASVDVEAGIIRLKADWILE
jgi:16S rRNA processing protein RimM